MARNLYAREHFYEDLHEHVARHRKLLDLVEAGDPAAVLAELAVHGERSFSEIQNNVGSREASSS
jgi:DNA-binding GntR family transcriptional regulator